MDSLYFPSLNTPSPIHTHTPHTTLWMTSLITNLLSLLYSSKENEKERKKKKEAIGKTLEGYKWKTPPLHLGSLHKILQVTQGYCTTKA